MLKEKIQRVVDDCPEDVDLESLVEKLYLLHKLDATEKQAAERDRAAEKQTNQHYAWWRA
jgi:hypothetical protein